MAIRYSHGRMFSKKLVAECFGTFCLVFAGTGAIVANDFSGGAVTHAGVALTFGLVVLAMIYSVGDISGAHLNPAVTLGFFAAGRFPGREVAPYVGSQLAGALAASFLLKALFPASPTLGATLPAGPVWQSFVLEAVLTAILMFTILNVSARPLVPGVRTARGAASGCTGLPPPARPSKTGRAAASRQTPRNTWPRSRSAR